MTLHAHRTSLRDPEGAVDGYLSHHARVPDELRALFERARMHDWSSGDRATGCSTSSTAMTSTGP